MIDDEITKLELEFHEKRLKQFNEHMPELISYLGLDEDKLLYGVRATINEDEYFQGNPDIIESLVLIQLDNENNSQDYSIISSRNPNKSGIYILDMISVPDKININEILAKYIQYFDEDFIKANKITPEDRYFHTFKNSIEITNPGKIGIAKGNLYIFSDKENNVDLYLNNLNDMSITKNILLRARLNKGGLFNDIIVPLTRPSDQETYNFLLKQL